MVTSKTNGNNIFLPVAGYRNNPILYNAGAIGDYWSSSLRPDHSSGAWFVYFSSSGTIYRSRLGGRYYGYSVRPVSE